MHEELHMDMAQMNTQPTMKREIPRPFKGVDGMPEFRSRPAGFPKDLSLSLGGMPQAVLENHHEFDKGPVNLIPSEVMNAESLPLADSHAARQETATICCRIVRSS